MKNISVFKGVPQRLEAVFSDGYITIIMWTGTQYRLEGNKRTFDTLEALAVYYKGNTRSIKQINERN